MALHTLLRTLVSSAAISIAAGGVVSAQTQTAGRRANAAGIVRGVVYDSIAQAPLGDAAVFLWNTPHRAVSDAEGRFELRDVPPGEYTLLFFHARLGEMGISPGPKSVRIVSGDTLDVSLATPSPFTMLTSRCLLEDTADGTGAIAGWVGDGESGTVLPNAQVTLSWSVDGRAQPERITVHSGSDGWFSTCAAPSATPITATASFFDRQGLRREVTVPEHGARQVGFLLWKLQPTKVSGRVVDADSDEGVADAEVWLRGTSLRAVTGSHGEFGFGEVPAGTYMMIMRHLRYGTKEDTLVVTPGETFSLEMRVDTRAIEMAPITVTVESVPLTRRAMGGITISKSDIDKVRGRVRDVGDILMSQQVSGVIVRRRGNGSLCVGFTSGQVRMLNNTSGGCVPMVVYINDVRATNTDLALQMPPESVDRIVVFKPIEAGSLFGGDSANGVMIIYTHNR